MSDFPSQPLEGRQVREDETDNYKDEWYIGGAGNRREGKKQKQCCCCNCNLVQF